MPKRFARLPLTILAALRAWAWAWRRNPDLIYTNTVTCPMGMILATLLRKPHIWHVREWVGEDMGSSFDLGQSMVMSLLRGGKNGMIFNSKAMARKYADYLPEAKAIVVYNGFDFSHVGPPDAVAKYGRTVADAGEIRLAVIGSIQPAKGQEDAIRALSTLRTRGLPVCLEIVGSGHPDHIDYLRTLARELAVGDHVSFPGYISDVVERLDPIAVVLVPSLQEPFGRIAVESMAHGTPVVAAAAGGLREIISDRATGLLYSPGNHAELAEKTATLLGDRFLYEAVVTGGWQDVRRRFSREQHVSGVWRAIMEALDKPPGPVAAEEAGEPQRAKPKHDAG